MSDDKNRDDWTELPEGGWKKIINGKVIVRLDPTPDAIGSYDLKISDRTGLYFSKAATVGSPAIADNWLRTQQISQAIDSKIGGPNMSGGPDDVGLGLQFRLMQGPLPRPE